MLGNHNTSAGKAISNTTLIASAITNGMTPRKIVVRGTSGTMLFIMNRFSPNGGVTTPISTSTTIMMPHQIGSYPRVTMTAAASGAVMIMIVNESITPENDVADHE